jgi:16S rRNA (adenine1518-N6/adenine1519-N6)-dimethyltransferase
MTQILSERGIQLTKSLGQNFLHDANQLRRIADAAELTKSDAVLEIGPGLGPLTGVLLERCAHVLAIEKDARLVRVLEEEFRDECRGSRVEETETSVECRASSVEGRGTEGDGRLTLMHADALEYLRNERRDWSAWKLVSNLPYSVASPILVELASLEHCPARLVATLQIEVAKRLMARPGNSDYGLLTLLAQVAYEPRGWFKIPASCFFPEPDVDSACICMIRREQKGWDPELRRTFVSVVKRSFSLRRKMMLKLLKQAWDAGLLGAAFADVKIPVGARAETLELEQFLALANYLNRHV